jgi:urate oxidase
MARLGKNIYGKSRVRISRITRHADRHDFDEWTVYVMLEGDFAASYTNADNSKVLPTDTMKNTVYALAAQEAVGEPEAFGLTLALHFLGRNPRLARVRIDLTEHPWGRIMVGNREHGQAFVRQGGESRSATIHGDRTKLAVGAGLTDLVVLKSSHSAFAGFLRDEYTTLADTEDRLLATSLSATWWYRDLGIEYGQARRAVRQTLLEAFAEHDSKSVQHTLHAMGQAVLGSIEDVTAIRLVMPNKHHLPFDLARVGLQNRNEIFVPTDEPFGLIEATLVR